MLKETCRLFLITVAICLFTSVLATDPVQWELEDYNDWNLPFAKTVRIKGQKGETGYTDGPFSHDLGASQYKLEVDPSALFSMIFVDSESFTDYTTDDLVTLNYTFYGDTVILQYEGVWTDITIDIPEDIWDNSRKSYKANFTIFVAIGIPPDNGLQGTLSVCVTPSNSAWASVSLLARLEEQYEFPQIYISFYFVEEYTAFSRGWIEFATENTDVNEMTFGGQAIVQDQIGVVDNILESKSVNPFIKMQLDQMSFFNVLLGNNQIFVAPFQDQISITPAEAATHMPTSIYNYMDENFFQELCKDPNTSFNYFNSTSTAVPLKACECEGD